MTFSENFCWSFNKKKATTGPTNKVIAVVDTAEKTLPKPETPFCQLSPMEERVDFIKSFAEEIKESS